MEKEPKLGWKLAYLYVWLWSIPQDMYNWFRKKL
jgi:hypothetical protein